MRRIALRVDWLLAMALASLLLYMRTLAPDVVDADGGELQFAAWNFSFVHPTGYPLFLIVGGLFQHLLPIGNPAFRLNVFNAILAAFAVGAFYLAAKETTQSRAVALMAAASFALSRTFWFNASGAEVYALNALFLAALIFIALRWSAHPNVRTFAIFCFVYGLALTHHRTIGLWIPTFVLFFVIVVRQKHFSPFPFPVSRLHFLLFAFAFLLPLLLYLYIPLRAPASPYYQLPITDRLSITLFNNSANGFVDYVLGRTFQQELVWDAASAARLLSTPRLLLDEFGAVGVALGALGLVAMIWGREWAALALTATGFAATFLFNAIYHIGDIAAYYIPAYLVWAVWIGMGIKYLRESIRNNELRFSSHKFVILALIAFAIPIYQWFANFAAADRSQELQARTQWTKILSVPIPPNAILISNDRDEMMPLWYIQYVENTRRDLLGLFPLVTPAPQHANIGRLTDGVLDANRPIFFIKPMPGIEIKYRVAPFDASLVRVLGRAADTSPQLPSGALLADRVRVLGYAISREPGVLRVAVYWQLRAKLTRDYTTFVHLLDTSGNKVAQGNDHQVGGEFYPTSLWEVGETLRDEQTIALPQNLAPGEYRLVAGMYHYPELDVLGEAVEIGAVELK